MPDQWKNQQEFSALIGRSARRIRQMHAHGIPHKKDGHQVLYPLPEAINWWIQRKRDEVLNQVERVDHQEAKARREAARARKEEIELEKRLGSLLTRDAHDGPLGEMLDLVRSTLMNAPGRYGALFVGLDDPRDAEKRIKEMVLEVLDHLSGPAADELEVGGAKELPEDFPARDKLLAAGVETYADLLAVDDLQDIHGIGPVTEKKILDALDGGEGRDAA